MSDQTFFVKMRNRVMGPFPLNRLQQMAQATKLNHAHEVSQDGSNWVKAGEFPEIFASPTPVEAPAAPVQLQPVAAAPVAPVAAATEQQEEVQDTESERGGPPGQIDWYYATDDEPVGPVTKSEIVEFIKSGDVVRSDRVWNAKMKDWQRAGKRPEFKAAFEQMYSDVPSVKAKTSNMLDLVRVLVASKQWLVALCVLLFCTSVSLLGLFFTSFGDGVSQGESIKVQQAILSLVLSSIFIGSMVMVYQYMVLSTTFIKTKTIDDLHKAMIWLNRFWMTLSAGILLAIVFLVLVITGVLQ